MSFLQEVLKGLKLTLPPLVGTGTMARDEEERDDDDEREEDEEGE